MEDQKPDEIESEVLTEQQKIFCREYIKDFNGQNAALRANYAKSSAHVSASRLLKQDKVQKEIERLNKKRFDKIELESEHILRELMKLGFSDIRTIFNEEDGTIKDPKDWPDDLAAAIASIEVFEEYQGTGKQREYIGRTKKIKFWDKTKALELMGKHKTLFTDKVEHSGSVTLHSKVVELVEGLESDRDPADGSD